MNRKFNCIFSAILLFAVLCISQISLAQTENFEKNPEKGIVYLYRPGKAVGAVLKTQIRVNGQEAGGTSNITEGGRVTLKLENEKQGMKAVTKCKKKLISTYPAN